MKVDIKSGFNIVKSKMIEKSPEILTGMGITGFILTGVLIGTASIKAYKRLEEVKTKEQKELTKKEVAKETWKFYVVPTIFGAASTACIIGASRTNHKRNVALATAYGMTERAFSDYKNEVAKVLGPKKLKEIEEKATVAKVDKPPIDSLIEHSRGGHDLWYDAVSGRYFYSDMNTVKSTINDINKRLLTEMYMSLNDLYYELGLPGIAIGGELGWHIDNGVLEPVFGTSVTPDGRSCMVLDYYVEPKQPYRTIYN